MIFSHSGQNIHASSERRVYTFERNSRSTLSDLIYSYTNISNVQKMPQRLTIYSQNCSITSKVRRNSELENVDRSSAACSEQTPGSTHLDDTEMAESWGLILSIDYNDTNSNLS